MPSRTMKAGEFKARCLKVMDEVAESGEPVVITKHGKAVAQLVPVVAKEKDLFGFAKGTVRIVGDVVSPVVDEGWEAEMLADWQAIDQGRRSKP